MSENISELTEKVDYLISFFQRRLPADRARDQLVGEVAAKLEERAALDSGAAFADLFVEALQAIDRLRTEEAGPELNVSVADELLEVFARRGLTPIPTAGQVDPAVHEVVGTRLAEGDQPAGEIVAVEREGFTLAGRVLRPARVTVAAG